jgi:signal transduction histidine kinase
MKHFIQRIAFVLFFTSQVSYSQTAIIDSLKIKLTQVKTDKEKTKILGDLTWHYRVISTDSSLKYGQQALGILNKSNDEVALAQQFSDMGAVYLFRGDMEASKANYIKALRLRRKNKDTLGVAKINANLSAVYLQVQKIDSAMILSIEAAEIFEKKGYAANALILKSNVANMYEKLNNYDKALQTHKEVLKAYKAQNNILRQANVYTNIGKTYLFKEDTTAAIASFKEAITLSKQINNNRTLGVAYANLGNILTSQNNYKEAIYNLKESLKVRTQLNSEFDISSLHLSLGILYLKTGKLALAKSHFSLSLPYFKKNNVVDKLVNIYHSYALISAAEKDFKSMSAYVHKAETLSNSYLSGEIKKGVIELETKYETAKKEKEILEQKEQILANKLMIKNRNLYIVLTSFALLFVALLSYGIFRRNQFKRKQLQKELDLKDALTTIKTQNRLQEQRLRISRDLHDNIGSQLTFIISSIDNLKFITKDATPLLQEKLSGISSFTSDTIFQLRDTIWAMNKNKITMEDLHARILSFIEKAKSAVPNIDFHFNQQVHENVAVTSLKGINLFRVVQEAINNAIKYANTASIHIEVSKIEDRLMISIADKGNGFDIKSIAMGNGLSNMEKRMSEIDGTVKIDSILKKGTTIQIICKL